MRPFHPVYLRLRRTNRYTRGVSFPAEYLRRHGLEEGAELEWIEEEDGSVRLRFMKLRSQELPQQQPVEAAE
jgi:hypothetical protein